MIIVSAFAIGIVAGLRTMMAPAAVSLAARHGLVDVAAPFAFLAARFAPWITGVAALGELVADKLPFTPSRKAPPGFLARLVTGGMSGAAIVSPTGHWWPGLLAGAAGAILGTLGGARARGWLAKGFDRDWPAAVVEDVIAMLAAVTIVATA